MNSYGRQAMGHWQQVDPDRFAASPDKTRFFTDLGEQAQEEIETRATALAGPDRLHESPEVRARRLNMARFTAETEVLREMVLIPASGRPRSRCPSPGTSSHGRSRRSSGRRIRRIPTEVPVRRRPGQANGSERGNRPDVADAPLGVQARRSVRR